MKSVFGPTELVGALYLRRDELWGRFFTARTTGKAVRRAIQNSQACLTELAARYGINPKTVTKWRRRSSVCELAWSRGSLTQQCSAKRKRRSERYQTQADQAEPSVDQ